MGKIKQSLIENQETASFEEGNTKTSSQVRSFCFTLNNYKEEIIDTLRQLFENKKWEYIFGKEVGECGTRHLQGYIKCKSCIRWTTIKKLLPDAHIECARSSKAKNIKYCMKDGDFYTNMSNMDIRKFKILQSYKDVVWKNWQNDIITICQNKDDNRKVYWFYEETGNTGKSFLCKYLYCQYNCLIGTGKKNDIFNNVLEYEKINEYLPDIIICDIPRYDIDFLNYGALEQIKNGLLYSGKYEGGTVIFDKQPIIICFANSEPMLNRLSIDRWSVRKIFD